MVARQPEYPISSQTSVMRTFFPVRAGITSRYFEFRILNFGQDFYRACLSQILTSHWCLWSEAVEIIIRLGQKQDWDFLDDIRCEMRVWRCLFDMMIKILRLKWVRMKMKCFPSLFKEWWFFQWIHLMNLSRTRPSHKSNPKSQARQPLTKPTAS